MTKPEIDCRACQEELAFARGQEELPPIRGEHLVHCSTCQSFATTVKELSHLTLSDKTEPSPDLVARTFERLSPELAGRTREGIWLRARLAVAGLVSLPVIVGLNGFVVWLVYTTFSAWLSVPIAAGAASIVAASTLLGLSLAYGSLPLMADWGLELRQRCHGLAASAPGLSSTPGVAADWRPQ